MSAVELTILGEIQPGHTYAVGLPPHADVDDVIEPLRRIQETSGAQIIVFAPGTSLADASSEALTDARAKADHLLGEVERLRALVAAADEYGDRHVIEMSDDGWTMAHPLSCRAAGLFDCPVNEAAADLDGPPQVGRYAVHVEAGRLVIGEPVR